MNQPPQGMPDHASRFAKFAEVLFGGLAKGTMALAAIIVVVLAVLSGNFDGLNNLPATRKGWSYVLLLIVVVFIGVIAFHKWKDHPG